MNEKTPNLQLPYILAAQAQKHVTHNEAIKSLDTLTQLTIEDQDLATPPASPVEGACYIVAISATDTWQGKEGQVAAWQDGAWMFYEPVEGWVAWLRDDNTQIVFDGAAWQILTVGSGGSINLNPATGALLGVNATADTTNRLSVNSSATLLNNEGTDHQLKINKNAVANNASVLFQTGFSGRAEFGITGNDDFHMKVSPDGSTFHEGIVIDKDTGEVSFPNTTFSGGGTAVNSVFGRTGAVITQSGDYSFDEITGVSQNMILGRLSSGVGAQEALSATQVRAFLNVEDNASTDQSGADIKSLYEAELDTNAYSDSEKTKLATIETNADITDEINVISALDNSSPTTVIVSASDKVLIKDDSDSDTLKSVTAQSIADLAASGNSGDVVGPNSSNDFGLAIFDGITGKNIQELGAGTSGQFLKTQGTGLTPVWETLAGGGDMLSSNNLSDIPNTASARANLGLEIGVDVAAPGATSSNSSTDLFAIGLKLAKIEGNSFAITDGIVDPFKNEELVDTVSSIGQIYQSSEGYYSNISGMTSIPSGTGTPFGDMTLDGGILAAFDGSISQNYTSTANKSGGDGYIGKTFSTAQKISSVDIYSSNNFGFAAGGSGNIDITLFGKMGSVPANSTDGINLGSVATFTDTNSLITKTIISNDLTTSWDHVWVRITDSNLVQVRIAELVFVDAGSASDLTLQSNAITATNVPTTAKIIYQLNPIDNLILNTDIIGSVSRDNGLTFSDAILVEKIKYTDGTIILESDSIDLSGQPFGTELKWRLKSLNNKFLNCSGVVLQWN